MRESKICSVQPNPENHSTHSYKIDDGNYIHGKIKGKSIRILVDTGSNPNLMDIETAKLLNLHIRQPVTQFHLFNANAGKMPVLGSVLFDIKLGNCTFPTQAYLIKNLSDKILIGRKFLRQYNCILNYTENSMTIDNVCQLSFSSNQSRKSLATSNADVEIGPQKSSVIDIKIDPSMVNQDILVTNIPGKQFSKMGITRTLLHPKSDVIPCRVLNFRNHPILIRKDEVVAQISIVQASECTELYTDDDLTKFDKGRTDS